MSAASRERQSLSDAYAPAPVARGGESADVLRACERRQRLLGRCAVRSANTLSGANPGCHRRLRAPFSDCRRSTSCADHVQRSDARGASGIALDVAVSPTPSHCPHTPPRPARGGGASPAGLGARRLPAAITPNSLAGNLRRDLAHAPRRTPCRSTHRQHQRGRRAATARRLAGGARKRHALPFRCPETSGALARTPSEPTNRQGAGPMT